MRQIYLEVAEEYVKGAGVPIGAAGSYSDVALQIKFSEMWDGLSKHITWLDANGENPTIVYLTADLYDGECYIVPIPAEAKAVAGDVYMSIKGADSSKATLSVSAEFRVLESIYDPNAEESVQPTPTVADQLQVQIDTVLARVDSARVSANEAKASEILVAGYANSANNAMASAIASASNATQKASEAAMSASNAGISASNAGMSASQARESASAAETARRQIADLTVSSVTGDAGTQASVVKTEVGGVFNLEFTIPKGDRGLQGETGLRGDRGERGEKGERGDRGERGLQGEQGIQGIPGEDGKDGRDGVDGKSFTIKALYSSLSELIANHPVGNEGDAYAVGTASNNNIYIWDIDSSAWTDIGKLEGPKGEDGKSAYQYAVDSGYTGTEEAFAQDLASIDTYATDEELIEGLAGKSDTGHTHTKSNITDFPTSMPASDVYDWAKASSKPTYTASEVGAAESSHTHTKSQITDFPTSMTPTAHTHTKSQITDLGTIGAAAAKGVTDNASKAALTSSDTNLATARSVYNHTWAYLNRTATLAAAETNYATYMARGEALNSSDTNPTVNGAISWTYA